MSDDQYYQGRLIGSLIVSAQKSELIAETAKQQQIQLLSNAQKDAEIRRLQAEITKLRSGQASWGGTDDHAKQILDNAKANVHANELKKKQQQLDQANATLTNQRGDIDSLHQKVDQLMSSLGERDEIILDWMHTNEAFKRLSRQYGKNLGKTDEERQKDLDQHILDVVEEDPLYSSTKPAIAAKKRSIT